MTHDGGKYFFLSRPRRFGKSLLVSTFKSYFEGKKDLFKGLAIERLEKEWTEYPVLHFSMASGKHMGKEQLQRYLLYILKDNEENYSISNETTDPNLRLSYLIRTLYQKTGHQVVVVIDEYDAPLLDVVHEETSLNDLRDIMRNFTVPWKIVNHTYALSFWRELQSFRSWASLVNLTIYQTWACCHSMQGYVA